MRLPLISVLVVLGSLLAGPACRGELRVVGTDLLGVEFSKALYELAGLNRLALALAFDGSRPGLDELKSRRADLALVLLPPGEQETLPGFSSLVVAYYCVVVLVPEACPLERISLGHLAAIFGQNGPAAGVPWSELGLGPEWASSAIVPVAPAVGVGLALEYFRHAVLRPAEVRTNVTRYRSPADLTFLLAGESRAVALAASPHAGGTAKIVAVSVQARRAAFRPTPENLHSGDYGLRLPLRLIFRDDARPALRPLLRYLFGDQASAHFERAEMVPLPPSARAQQVLALEND